MAHIGKAYRLAFRRDLSLQVSNYRKGWPAQFVPLINNVFGSTADAARRLSWVLNASFDAATGDCNYESTHQLCAGAQVYCKLVGSFTGVPPFYTCRMQWFKEPSVKLYEQTVLDAITQQYFSFGKDQRDGVIFETPHVFECIGQLGSFNGMNAKGWH